MDQVTAKFMLIIPNEYVRRNLLRQLDRSMASSSQIPEFWLEPPETTHSPTDVAAYDRIEKKRNHHDYEQENAK